MEVFFIYAHFFRQSYYWEANSCSINQDIFVMFMESEGSLQCLQEPATDPFPQPD
jgi:hypothetical protein